MAVERLAAQTLLVVPTVELLAQWRRALGGQLGLPAGAVGGGGRREVRDLTVITFGSAVSCGRNHGRQCSTNWSPGRRARPRPRAGAGRRKPRSRSPRR